MRNGGESLTIHAYHQRTKHGYGRFAAGPRFLDWATQPFPFRLFAGAPTVELPFSAGSLPVAFHTLHAPGAIPPKDLGLEALGAFLHLGLGLTAVKEGGGVRWALRANPSSGNLHPTEGYLLWPGSRGLRPGVYHYVPRNHLLEGRALLEEGTVLPWRGFFAGLTAIPWREAWKYGERAYRYVLLDAGHALASLRYAAAALGWDLRTDLRWPDAWGESLLGLDRERDFRAAERESFELLAWVSPPGSLPPDPSEVRRALQGAAWKGQANRLSTTRTPWEAVDRALAAARTPEGLQEEPAPPALPRLPALLPPARDRRAAEVILGRRSGVAYDGRTAIPREAFLRMADALLPRPGVPPWDALPGEPRVHALFFAHRVEGLAPGLYLLPRRASALPLLRRALPEGFSFREAEGAPPHLGLLLLREGDLRREARHLSCGQEIASHSAFAVSFLAEFDPGVRERPWTYRWLHAEAGAAGQALYLWAEAEGFRGTGIGCFFDDEVHRFLGLRGEALQVLYHFTVGTALEDPRLATLPPYGHLPPRPSPPLTRGTR
ncbi:MAG: nitroreductase family protein [Acidobacteriota bacterium]